ncbi:MAG: hypothetical protein GX666_13185, partial [Tissierellia bacterium]|nr:hypothetical protein [Tissierellia bacterium]
NNTVTGNTCNSNSNGIRLYSSSNNMVTGNTCYNNSYGIYLSSSSNNNTVTGNTCNNNTTGIYLFTSSNNTVTGNTCIRGTGTPENYTTSQYTIFLYGTGNNYNLISSNNCMGKAVVIGGGTGNTVFNNKWDDTDDFTAHLTDYTQHPYYAGDTGSTGTGILQITLPVTYSSWSAVPIGACFSFKNIFNNQTIASGIKLALAGLAGEKPILKSNGNLFTTLTKDAIYTVRWNGVNFILQGEGASGNATASDLLSGKTATTDAGEIVGTMPNRSGTRVGANYVTTDGTTIQFSPPLGYYPGDINTKVEYNEPNLLPANIITGASILGVYGSAVTGGAKVKSIQTIESSIGGNTTTNTHTISAVNVTNSVVMLTAAYTSTEYYVNPGNASLCASLSDSTTLKIERTFGGSPVRYRAYVVEFETGVTIQRGLSIPTKYTYMSDSFHIPISSVDTSRSILLCSFRSGYDNSYRDARGYYELGQGYINVTYVVGINASNYTNFLFSWYIITFN